jgi:hypothetical protein
MRAARLAHEAGAGAPSELGRGGPGPHAPSQMPGAAPVVPADRPLVNEQTREVLERFWHHRHELLAKASGGRDEDKLDLAVTRRMLKEGLPQEQVALALDIASPRLSQRHPDSWAYAQQVVRTASEGPHKGAPTPGRTTGGHDIDR